MTKGDEILMEIKSSLKVCKFDSIFKVKMPTIIVMRTPKENVLFIIGVMFYEVF